MVRYFVRLDDLCPTNNLDKWARFFNLFDQYGIKPIIAVIPENRDPKLENCGPFNPAYWDLVRDLQHKGYVLAMHGYEHRYVNNSPGLFKHNNQSEFAGLPLDIQEFKIRKANKIFQKEGIHVKMFVAPSHSFDHNTLIALRKQSKVDIISDGLLDIPYKRAGFKWIPVQLSEATLKKKNTWTFNYHPETCTEKAFNELANFISKHNRHFGSIEELQFRNYKWYNYLAEQYLIHTRLLRQFLKKHLPYRIHRI